MNKNNFLNFTFKNLFLTPLSKVANPRGIYNFAVSLQANSLLTPSQIQIFRLKIHPLAYVIILTQLFADISV